MRASLLQISFIIDLCLTILDSKLADRTSSQNLQTPLTPDTTATAPTSTGSKPGRSTTPTLTSLRHDLAQAQTTKTHLTAQLTSLTTAHTTLQSAHSATTARLTQLEASNASLARKLRDREDELRRKKELLERVQDELLAAEMQVNVAEGERRRVEVENRELVGRLVGEKEVEVERMNRMGGWG